MEKTNKSKAQIVVRLKNTINPYDLATKHGFIQVKNGMEMPNVNSLMCALFEFAVEIDNLGIELSSLSDKSFIDNIKK